MYPGYQARSRPGCRAGLPDPRGVDVSRGSLDPRLLPVHLELDLLDAVAGARWNRLERQPVAPLQLLQNLPVAL